MDGFSPASRPVREAAPFLGQTMVLIPALNEASCIAGTLQQWIDIGVARVRVVDNGSTDDTAHVAGRWGAEVLKEPRRGYGAAAWCGLQHWPSDMEWVLFSSADGSDRLSAEEARRWQEAVQDGADLIVGDRMTHPDSRAHLRFAQRLGNGITCRALQAGWGRRFRDMGSLRLVRHRALMELNLADRGFGWNVEMQVRAVQRGWNIVEIPVHYHPRTAGHSKISGSVTGTLRAGSAILGMLHHLWRLRRTRPPPHPGSCK